MDPRKPSTSLLWTSVAASVQWSTLRSGLSRCCIKGTLPASKPECSFLSS